MQKQVENLRRELGELTVKLQAMEAMEERGGSRPGQGQYVWGFNLPGVPRLPVSGTVEDSTKALLAVEGSILTTVSYRMCVRLRFFF